MRVIFALFCFIPAALAHVTYQDMIPNGHSVPDPCSNGIWGPVGHYSPTRHTVEKNPFGLVSLVFFLVLVLFTPYDKLTKPRPVCAYIPRGLVFVFAIRCVCIRWKLSSRFACLSSKFIFYTPLHDRGAVLWFHVGCPCVRLDVSLSCGVRMYFLFQTKTWVTVSWTCALILQRSGSGLLMDKISSFFFFFFFFFFDNLSACHTSVFSFPDDILRQYKWISPNFVCALVSWRSGFGSLMGKFRRQFLTIICPNTSLFSFLVDNLSQYQWSFTKLGMCLILWGCLGLLIGKFRPSTHHTIVARYYRFTFSTYFSC